MSNNEQLTIINETDDIKLVHHFNKEQDLILVRSNEDLLDFKPFKSINVFESFINNERFILLALEIPSNDISSWYDLLVSNFDGSLINTLNKIKKIFDKESSASDYLKFRGDYAEALFISMNPQARKLPETESADIELDSKMIEIKSFSPNKRTITISLKQINENSIKLALPLWIDNEGKNILELAESINDESFSEYLLNAYQETEYALVKYRNSNFIDVSSTIPNMTLPEIIVDADFVVDISGEIIQH